MHWKADSSALMPLRHAVASVRKGSVAKFDFWAKSRNWVSGIQGLTDPQTLEKATLRQNRKTFWIFSKRLCLRHIGDVTVVLSKKGRNVGPNHTKILVTNLDEWTPRQVVCAYQRRWPVEQINRELKTDLGLGEHQVSADEQRIEKSFGIAVLAYLLLIRAGHQEILPGTSWSIAQLQHTFRLRIITNQVEHKVKTQLTKARKVA